MCTRPLPRVPGRGRVSHEPSAAACLPGRIRLSGSSLLPRLCFHPSPTAIYGRIKPLRASPLPGARYLHSCGYQTLPRIKCGVSQLLRSDHFPSFQNIRPFFLPRPAALSSMQIPGQGHPVPCPSPSQAGSPSLHARLLLHSMLFHSLSASL